jgi:hypothetical protein
MNNIKIKIFNLLFFYYLGNKAWLNLNLLPSRVSEKYKVQRIMSEDLIKCTRNYYCWDVRTLILALPVPVLVLLFPARPCAVHF